MGFLELLDPVRQFKKIPREVWRTAFLKHPIILFTLQGALKNEEKLKTPQYRPSKSTPL